MQIPDRIAPIYGFRAWRLGIKYRLLSPFTTDVWPLGQAVHAHCLMEPSHVDAPHSDCKCGIHGSKNLNVIFSSGVLYKSLQKAARQEWTVSTMPGVVGIVKMWGRVIQHELGWRAEFAQPEVLVIPIHKTEVGDVLQRDYHCNIKFVHVPLASKQWAIRYEENILESLGEVLNHVSK